MKLELYENVSLADSKVTIHDVLTAIGYPDPDYASAGAKVNCPFMAVFHPDSGKSFRVYDNGSAYCFACSERWGPVSLYSAYTDLPLDVAAQDLLERIGYKEPTPEERVAKALSGEYDVDQHALQEALKRFCSRLDPLWEVDQFDISVARKFRQCVELLPAVRTREDTRLWLAAAKTAMTKELQKVKAS